MKKAFILLSLSAMLLAGCSQGGAGSATGSTSTSSGGGEAAIAPKPVLAEALKKTEAFQYMALDREAEYSYLFSQMEGMAAEAGTQKTTLLQSSDQAAKFEITRGGSLSSLGTEQIEVRPDGIYQLKMSIGDLKKPMIIMPAAVKPGDTWDSLFEVDSTNQKTTFKVANKAVGVEKIKVKSGEYDALKVTSNGTMTMTSTTPADPSVPGSKAKTSTVTSELVSTAWYAKGVGSVKMDILVKKADKSTVKSSVELSSTGEKAK